MQAIRKTGISRDQRQYKMMKSILLKRRNEQNLASKKVLTGLLEKHMKEHFESKIYERLEKAVELADIIISHDDANVSAYCTAAETYIFIDDMDKAEGYIDRLLEKKPDELDALFLKLIVLENSYINNANYNAFIRFIDISEQIRFLHNNDPEITMYLINRCPKAMMGGIPEFNTALEIEPDNKSLLYRKGITLTLRFEYGMENPEDFNEIVRIATHLKEMYPESRMTRTLIEDSYNAFDIRNKRIFRKAMDMPELHQNNVVGYESR